MRGVPSDPQVGAGEARGIIASRGPSVNAQRDKNGSITSWRT